MNPLLQLLASLQGPAMAQDRGVELNFNQPAQQQQAQVPTPERVDFERKIAEKQLPKALQLNEEKLRQHEGFKTEFYVPTKNGQAIGASGVTIAGGVDLGAQTEKSLPFLLKYVAPEDQDTTKQILQPFFGKKKDAALEELKNQKSIGNLGLRPDVLEAIQKGVQEEYGTRAINRYYNVTGGNDLAKLKPEEQQVLFEMNYQGVKKFNEVAKALNSGDRQKAITVLKLHPQYKQFKNRFDDYIKDLENL